MSLRLFWAAIILAAVAIVSFTMYKVTDPYRGYDFDRSDPQPIVEDTLPPIDLTEGFVRHPITGEWITEEQARQEEQAIKAILCSYGKEEYCG